MTVSLGEAPTERPTSDWPTAKSPTKLSLHWREGVPSAISLFSGCGGSDAGLLTAGFDIVMANDKLSYARDVYLANHPSTDYVLGDISKIDLFPDAELLVGCYPCQGFSQ